VLSTPAPTYRLKTFGKLALSGGTTEKLSPQRRRLALLALLSASGERGVSRDQLLAYLWSESSAANARHSLEQLLYAMRRALGEDVFVGVNPLALDAAVISSDVNDFERALGRGSLTEAVALYEGPFLEGFYLEDAPELGRWTETERARLAARHAEALGRLAGDADAAGDHSAAVRWHRRLVEADPVSTRSALGFMRALVASGDRTAALQHARIYEALVQQELESEPDPSITAYVAALRAQPAAPSPRPEIRTIAEPPVASQSATASIEEAAPVKGYSPARADAPASRRSRYLWLAGISAAAALLLTAALSNRHRGDVPALDANRIVIVPFRTGGADSSVNYLGEGVVDLLAPMLTGEGGPVAVDSRTAISTWNRVTAGREGTADDARQVARELGAGLALTGAIVDVGGTMTITGTVISVARGSARPLTSVTAPSDSVNTLLDRFVGQLLARQSGIAETSVSAVTSQSLPAIRAYLTGRAAYRRADEDLAIESFTRALEIDSTFALAALDLAVATGKLLRTRLCVYNECRIFSIMPGLVLLSERVDDQFDRAVRLAWEHRSRLGRRDRPLLDALRGDNYPLESSARRTMESLSRAVGAAPDRPEAHYLLGLFLLYQGPALERTDARAQAEAAFRAASRLDSSYLAPLARMVDVAAFDGDTAKLRRAGALYLARDTAGATADYVRWLVALGAGDVAGQRAIRARFRSLDRATLQQIFLTSQMSGMGLDDADTAATLIIEQTADPIDKSVALRRAQLLALNRGRPAQATGYLRRRQEVATSDHQFRNFTIVAALFDDGERAVADSSVRAASRSLARDTIGPLSPDGSTRTIEAMATQAMWDLEHGDTARAITAIDWLRRNSSTEPRSRVLAVLPAMLLESHARRPEGAVLRAFVDSIALEGCCDLSPFGNLALAHAYEDSGDEVAALRVIRRGMWLFPPRAVATHRREEGRLAARLGDRAGAIRAYTHYLALRSDPEPGLRAARDSIRAEVRRLERER
jgi:DNA-binding SARP family transcriptional activator/TolB-like protein